MIDKLLLNNQLLANKKKVQQAKVNVISKLVKKIRKIKKLQESKPQDTKLKRKIERVEEILAYVKKSKSVELLKKSLINDRNPTGIITNGNSTSEEVAEALLFAHKSVSEITRQLKELLHLNDSTNPGWKDQLLESSKRKLKSLRTAKRKENVENTKGGNKSWKKRNEWIEQNSQLNAKQDDEVRSNASEPKGWEITSKSASSNNMNKEKKYEKQTALQFLSKNKQSESTQTVDPFFVTKAGENYLSSVVIDRDQPQVHNDGLVRKERRAELFGYKEKRVSRFKKYGKKSNSFQHNTNNEQGTESAGKNVSELHPSWAAKRKQKEIHEFQGKKIKFEEDGVDSKETDQTRKNVKNNSNSSNATKEKLHPSWEAKQKMKPVITDFKGTKIVFGD